MPDLKEFEAMADHIIAAGFFWAEGFIGAPNAKRAQHVKISAEGGAGWARLLRKVLGAKALPVDAEVERAGPLG